MASSRKIQVSVNLEDQTYEQLLKMSLKFERSMSKMGEIIIKKYFDEEGKDGMHGRNSE